MRIVGEVVKINHIGRIRKFIVTTTFKDTDEFRAIAVDSDGGDLILGITNGQYPVTEAQREELHRVGNEIKARNVFHTIAESQVLA